ncbi:MAG: hypothetical protein N4A35_10710 [Flavobacteriales bacterium]|jgi:hypothetical protein|nr:hypothetical protein [Flavobacteriales bacterium]
MEEQANKGKKKDGIYIVIIVLLLAGIGYLAFALGEANKQNKTHESSITALLKEKEDLNTILKNSGIIEESDDAALRQNLVSLLDQYDNIEIENQEMQDSIDNQRARITSLIEEVDGLKNQQKRDWGRIYKLKKETETLRDIMKGYIHTIDSLNTLNGKLQNTIIIKDNQITEVSSERDQVKSELDKTKNMVALGSVLQTAGITANAIIVKNSGKQVETSRAKRTNMIKSCFTIIENKIAKAGNKEIIMVVIDPNGKVLKNSSSFNFDAKGASKAGSVKRQINYQNQNVDLCIYFEVEGKIDPGTYTTEIYAEGAKIGSTTFALK